ncbi:MAG: IS6 family transposase [Candidatus Bathyarchaeota archaeon]|nr:IS6 family transposase [Candidatus Bathyarchaeota archaeon]
MKIEVVDFRCKFCNSANIIKYGKFRGIQRYWCNDCKRKFADNDALPSMKTSAFQVGAALNMYYEGMSLNAIRRHLEQTHHNYPSDSTVYEWVDRFTKEAISEAKDCKPNVGDVWVADETVLKIDGKNTWFWDIIDSKTRFLLASVVSTNRGIREAKALMEKAQARAGKTPKIVLTDKLAAYVDGIEQAFGADSKHIQSKPFALQNSTNLIERFHGTLKDRTKVMRGLKEIETAKLFTDGWLVHYNFFRPHETLGKTPAEAAGIKFNFRNWQDVVNQPRIVVSKLRIEDVVSPKPHKTRVQPFRFPEIVHRQQPMSNAMYAQGTVLSRHPFPGSRKIAQGKRGKGILLKM